MKKLFLALFRRYIIVFIGALYIASTYSCKQEMISGRCTCSWDMWNSGNQYSQGYWDEYFEATDIDNVTLNDGKRLCNSFCNDVVFADTTCNYRCPNMPIKNKVIKFP